MKKLAWKLRRNLNSMPAQEPERAEAANILFSSDFSLTVQVKSFQTALIQTEPRSSVPASLALSVFPEQQNKKSEPEKASFPFAGQTSGPLDLQFCDGTSAQKIQPAETVTATQENSGWIVIPGKTDPEETVTVSNSKTVVLPYEVPQAEYMYGCTATAVGMLLGYYDRYGYLGYDVSNLIEGEVELNARGLDGDIYDMDAFDTVLGSAIASREHVERFFDQSPEYEYPYTFVEGTTDLNISIFNCIADYLGTNQYWRGNGNYSTTYYPGTSLADIIRTNETDEISSGGMTVEIPIRNTSLIYGLMLYVRNAGYTLDEFNTRNAVVDTAGGSFTFENYMEEIEAGRAVLIHIEGHTMVGYGYDSSTKEIIFDDTYHHDQRMRWGGTFYYAEEDRPIVAITTIHFNTADLKPMDSDPEPEPVLRIRSDINGNGTSDVVFQYTGGDCQIGFWMDGTDAWRGQGIAEPAGWEVLGAYDMDSSGKADIVMFGNVVLNGIRCAYIGYRVDGDMSTWENIGFLTNPDNIQWTVKLGNVTGADGKNSIVWHAPELGALGVWIDGTDEWKSISGCFNESWELCGTGDFNGDDTDEILLRNNDSYYMTDLNGTLTPLGSTGTGWALSAVGDFSGDGKDDLVFTSSATGAVMKFENGKASGYAVLGQLDIRDWFICGAGDYNGDGKDDLLVRQYSSGMLGWYDGGDMSKWHELGRGVDMNWTVIA